MTHGTHTHFLFSYDVICILALSAAGVKCALNSDEIANRKTNKFATEKQGE